MDQSSWVSWLNRSRKVVLFGNSITFVVLLAVSAFLLTNVYRKTERQLESNARFAAQLLKVPAGTAMWNFDLQSLELMREQTKSTLINGVRFYDKDGKPVIPDEPKPTAYRVFEVTEKIKDSKGEAGGSITIIYNKETLLPTFYSEVTLVAIGLAISILIQIGSLFGGVWSSQRMQQALGHLLNQIKGASDITLTQATEVSMSSEQNLGLATTQASAVQKTVSAAEQISAMMRHTSDRVEHSSRAARESLDVARRSVQQIEKMTSTVTEINSTTNELFESVSNGTSKIEQIRARMQLISDKTRVINDIVFQTRLLSFNAAVEAARAGEHGKGFAVVAEEIGNLALMSGKASSEIDEILRESVNFTKEITEGLSRNLSGTIGKSRTCVTEGVQVANACGENLARLLKNIEAFMQDLEEVVRATGEQQIGVTSIAAAMAEIDDATQRNIASVKSTEHSVSQMIDQASMLADLVKASSAMRKSDSDQLAA